MALTLATELANYAAGIGTQGATLKIDSANKRVGVGTTNPQGPEGSLQVGTGITFFGNTGIISAIGGKFSGDFTVGGTLTYEDVQNVNSSGIVTAQSGINVVGGGLTVTGVSTFFSRVSIADSIVHTGDIDTSLRFPAANTFTLETGGSERIRVSAAGSFGIGTNDPTESLHIDGNLRMGATADSGNFTDSRSTTTRALTIGAAGDALLVTHSSGQGLGFFGYEAGGDRLVIACDAGSGGNKIDFITDAGTSNDADNLNGKVPKMRITSAGDVGIGTQAPETPRGNKGLEVAGTTGAEIVATRYDDNLADGDFIGGFVFKNLDAGGTPNHFAGMYAKANGTAGSMDLHFSSDRAQYEADTSDLVIRSGNVGINSASPGSQLSVDGDIGLYGSGTNHRNLYIFKDNVSTAWFKYRGDTNSVIIGTNAGDKLTINPSGDLNVAGITTATQLFEGTTRVATTGKAIAMAMLFG